VLDTPAAQNGCRDWGGRVTAAVATGGYDLVVVSAASLFDVVGADDQYPAEVAGYADVLGAWDASRVLVIRDSPFPGFDIPECVATSGPDASRLLVIRDSPFPGFDIPECVATSGPAGCTGARAAWLPVDPLADAAASLVRPGLSIADLSDLFCSDDACFSVIGGVLVYVDYSHFGATFARTLAPYLAPALDSALHG
jgi:hypothetical protein